MFHGNKSASGHTREQAAGAGIRRKKTKKRLFFGKADVLLVVAAVALLVSSLVFPVLMVSGDSMEPGLNDGDLVLLVKTRSLDPGDLICFRWRGNALLKRVVARPGDWVMMDEAGRVYVNGALLEEPYVAEFAPGESDIAYPFQVPEDSYFVMGDSRASSMDSRNTRVGCVKYDQIVGKGVLRVWPLGASGAGRRRSDGKQGD